MRVRFENVGRDRQSWDAELTSTSDRALIREIYDKQALMSKAIDFDWNVAMEEADIVVGGSRIVGRIIVET